MGLLTEYVRRTAVGLAVLMPLALGAATESRATAMFSADASVTVTITDIDNLDTPGVLADLKIAGGVFPDSDVFFLAGNATGAASAIVSPETGPPLFDLFPLFVGDSLSLVLSASGTANPLGEIDAFADALGLIAIDNFSLTDRFEVFFDLDVTLGATASLDDPVFEDALGFAAAIVDTFGDVFFDEFVLADALFGIFDPDIALSTSFSLIVGPDDFEDLFVDAFVDGFAVHIPAPGGGAGFLLGLAALGVLRRRKSATGAIETDRIVL